MRDRLTFSLRSSIFLLLLCLQSQIAVAQLIDEGNVTQTVGGAPSINVHQMTINKTSSEVGHTINFTMLSNQPANETWIYTIESLPLHGTIEAVRQQGDEIPSGIAIYHPFNNFTGTDSFSYKISPAAVDGSSQSGLVTLKTYIPNLIIKNSWDRVYISFTIAGISILIIILVVWRILKRIKGRISRDPINSTRFTDIIRSRDMDPSLSILQFFSWTIVLMFAFISVYLIRIFGGVYEPSQEPVPVYLMAIAGISVTTPLASAYISYHRYSTVDAGDENGEPTSSHKRPPLAEMLREFGKPSLSRFQMFAWTWIGIGIYLTAFYSNILTYSNDVVNLSVPDVYEVLVILMGLSQVAFLGGKAAGSEGIEITKIYPKRVKQKGNLSIFGKNFGNDRQDVWIGEYIIKFGDHDHLEGWSDRRIDIKVPEYIQEDRKYQIMVSNGGSSKIAMEGAADGHGSKPIEIEILKADPSNRENRMDEG